MTNKERDLIAQEICFFTPDGPNCYGNCKKCPENYWHRFRLSAQKAVKLWEKIKKCKNNIGE